MHIAYCALNLMQKNILQKFVKITVSLPEFVDHKRSSLVFLLLEIILELGIHHDLT